MSHKPKKMKWSFADQHISKASLSFRKIWCTTHIHCITSTKNRLFNLVCRNKDTLTTTGKSNFSKYKGPIFQSMIELFPANAYTQSCLCSTYIDARNYRDHRSPLLHSGTCKIRTGASCSHPCKQQVNQ